MQVDRSMPQGNSLIEDGLKASFDSVYESTMTLEDFNLKGSSKLTMRNYGIF